MPGALERLVLIKNANVLPAPDWDVTPIPPPCISLTTRLLAGLVKAHRESRNRTRYQLTLSCNMQAKTRATICYYSTLNISLVI